MSIDKVIELIEKQMVLTLMKNQNSTTMGEIYENSVNAAKACKQIREIFSGKEQPKQEGNGMNNFDPLRPSQAPTPVQEPRYPQMPQPQADMLDRQVRPYSLPDNMSPFGLADQRQESSERYPQPAQHNLSMDQPRSAQPRPQFDPIPVVGQQYPVAAQQQVKGLDEARAELASVIEEIHEMSKSVMLLQRTVVDRVGELQGRVNVIYTRVYSALNKLG
jgi:hypothetical protein